MTNVVRSRYIEKLKKRKQICAIIRDHHSSAFKADILDNLVTDILEMMGDSDARLY